MSLYFFKHLIQEFLKVFLMLSLFYSQHFKFVTTKFPNTSNSAPPPRFILFLEGSIVIFEFFISLLFSKSSLSSLTPKTSFKLKTFPLVSKSYQNSLYYYHSLFSKFLIYLLPPFFNIQSLNNKTNLHLYNL